MNDMNIVPSMIIMHEIIILLIRMSRQRMHCIVVVGILVFVSISVVVL